MNGDELTVVLDMTASAAVEAMLAQKAWTREQLTASSLTSQVCKMVKDRKMRGK